MNILPANAKHSRSNNSMRFGYARPRFFLHVLACCGALLLICCVLAAQGPGRPQSAVEPERHLGFRAVSYDVYASLSPADQTISAKATVEFEAREPSSTVESELHPNLRITDVRDASGRPLAFNRGDGDPLLVRVSLNDSVPVGQKVKLTFTYAGPLANEDASPVRGVRLAWIGNTGAYLLLPARWFPLTDYPSNRYAAVFHIDVPQNFAVAGTGTPEPSGPAAPGSLISSAPESAPASPMLGNRNPAGEAAGAPVTAYKNGKAAPSKSGAAATTPTSVSAAIPGPATGRTSLPSTGTQPSSAQRLAHSVHIPHRTTCRCGNFCCWFAATLSC